MDYWKKLNAPNATIEDILEWGIPEQKTGALTIIGGNSQNFLTPVRITEQLSKFPLQNVNLILPDILRKKVPPVPNIDFSESTEAGSFKKSKTLNEFVKNSDFSLFIGDISKNSETSVALSNAISEAESTPVLLTRDAIDSVTSSTQDFIERDKLFLVASLAQLQKLFRSLLYPKMIMLSNPLMPVIEALHKFTLSYEGVTILTFHEGQIIIASKGDILTIPISNAGYTPLSLWSGELAAKIAMLNLWNQNSPLFTTSAAVFWQK